MYFYIYRSIYNVFPYNVAQINTVIKCIYYYFYHSIYIHFFPVVLHNPGGEYNKGWQNAKPSEV